MREGQLKIAIIGAGATGVELAAELHKATRQLVAYGLDRIDPERDVRITPDRGGPGHPPALPERLQKATLHELERLGVRVCTGERVVEVTEGEVRAPAASSSRPRSGSGRRA